MQYTLHIADLFHFLLTKCYFSEYAKGKISSTNAGNIIVSKSFAMYLKSEVSPSGRRTH